MTALSLLGGLSLSCVVFAETVDNPASLSDFYKDALQNNPKINSYMSQLTAATARYSQSKSALFPQLSAGGSYSYGRSKTDYSGSSNFTNSDNTSSSRALSLSLRQALFHKTDFATVSQQEVAEDLAKASLNSAQQQLMQDISEAYFAMLSAKQNLVVATAQRTALEKHLERAKVGFKLGVIGINDKLDAQARYDIAIADEIDAENKLLIAKNSLEVMANTTIRTVRIPASLLNLSDLQHDLPQWESLAEKNNMTIVLADYARQIAQYEVKKTRGQRYPVLDLILKASEQRQYSSFARADSDTTVASASLELSMPLFTSGLISSRIDEAQANSNEKLAELEDAKRNIMLSIRREYLTAASLKKQFDALRSAQQSSQVALEAAQKGLEVGTRTTLDVLDAQKQLYDVQRNLAASQYNFLFSEIKLKNIAGILKVEDLAALDKLLGAS